MPINYYDIKQKAWGENINALNLSDSSVIEKISNWAKLRDIPLDDLLEDINHSKYFKYAFAATA